MISSAFSKPTSSKILHDQRQLYNKPMTNKVSLTDLHLLSSDLRAQNQSMNQ